MPLYAATDSRDAVRLVSGSRHEADAFAEENGGRVAEVTPEQAAAATAAWPAVRRLMHVLGEPAPTRTVLLHLNVTVPGDDDRDADEVGSAVMGAIEVGSDDDAVRRLDVALALADDLGWTTAPEQAPDAHLEADYEDRVSGGGDE